MELENGQTAQADDASARDTAATEADRRLAYLPPTVVTLGGTVAALLGSIPPCTDPTGDPPNNT